ncbi:MAG TPA: nucleotidyltransferase domain-containing protein [Gammaproteobacteria bacterium]|nr:nucleotidyltransferase domain-containing protein [Gammaproteobacteria bacterium]
MRLTKNERTAITGAVHAVFGEDAEVRLFGSRAEDARRGGDIYLYIEVDPDCYSYESELDLHAELLKRIGDQKIDILVHKRGQPRSPIERIAVATGVPL